jgi:hypothetical protein
MAPPEWFGENNSAAVMWLGTATRAAAARADPAGHLASRDSSSTAKMLMLICPSVVLCALKTKAEGCEVTVSIEAK